MPLTPPTFVSEADTAYNSVTTPKALSVVVQAGDLIVVVAASENSPTTLAVTATGLTFTKHQEITTANYGDSVIWSATAASTTTYSVSLANSGSVLEFGMNVSVWRDHGGAGASVQTVNTGGPSVSLTTTADNSAIVCGFPDWNSGDGTTRTWRTINGSVGNELVYGRNSSTYAWYANRWNDAGTAGAVTVGLSAPSTIKYAIVALEIKGVTSSAIDLAPGGIATGNAFGTPALIVPTTLAPTGVGTGNAFGTPALLNVNTLSPGGVATGEAFGAPTLTNLNTLAPTGIATGGAFGTPTLTVPVNAQPTGFGGGETFGTPTIAATLNAQPTGIASGETFGTPLLAVGSGLVPPGITSGETFGTPTLVVPINAQPTGINDPTTFGTPQITWPVTLSPSGIASAATFGAPTVAANVILTPTGIATGNTFGTPTLTVPAGLAPTGIGTGGAFGTPTVINMSFVLPDSISSGEAFGTPAVTVNSALAPTGIGTGAAFGAPAINNNVKVMLPTGITGLGNFGTPTVTADDWRQIIERGWWKEAVNNHQRTVGMYAEMINDTGGHIIDLPLSGGSIDYDGEAAEQWGCSITIIGQEWVPRSPKDPLDPRSSMRCRIWWRLQHGAGWVSIPVGTYILEDPQVRDDGTTPIITVKGSDPLTLIRRNGYGNNVVKVGGLTVPAALARIFQVVAAGQPIQIDSTSTVTMPTTYELTGGDPLDDLTNIAAQAGLVIRTDRLGRIVCSPEPDTEDIRADWQEGEDCPVIDMDRDISSSNMVNSVTVVSTSPEVTPPISVTVEDTDPSSPTWVGGKWGRRSITIRTDSVATEEGATALATATLNGRRRPMETITVEVPQRGDLGFRDPIKLHRAASYVADTYRISKWSLPLAGADDAPPTMSVTMMSRSTT